MNSTRIHILLSGLSRKDLNRFVKFVDSPYFNTNEPIRAVVNLLVSSLKSQRKDLTKQMVWVCAFPNSKIYNDTKFRKLCNDILSLFEEFLSHEQLKKTPLLSQNQLLIGVSDRKIQNLIDKLQKSSDRLIAREQERSAEYYLRQYNNRKILQNIKVNLEKKRNVQDELRESSYSELTKNLDTYYVIEKLRHATDILSWQKIYKTDIKIDLGYTLELIDKYSLKDIPTVNIYFLMYKLMAGHSSEKDYKNLKKLANQEIDYFPNVEQKEILDVLLSYVIKNVNQGHKSALKEVVDLYDWGISTSIILSQGVLSPTTFRNYVVGCLRLGHFERAESFIKVNSVLLNEDERENALNFNLSRVAFRQRKFDEVLTFLREVTFENIWYAINARPQLIATYYELNEYHLMESQMDSYSTYLRRERSLDQKRKLLYSNFVHILRKIYKSNSSEELVKIKKELLEIKIVVNKDWLLEKIDELL